MVIRKSGHPVSRRGAPEAIIQAIVTFLIIDDQR